MITPFLSMFPFPSEHRLAILLCAGLLTSVVVRNALRSRRDQTPLPVGLLAFCACLVAGLTAGILPRRNFGSMEPSA